MLAKLILMTTFQFLFFRVFFFLSGLLKDVPLCLAAQRMSFTSNSPTDKAATSQFRIRIFKSIQTHSSLFQMQIQNVLRKSIFIHFSFEYYFAIDLYNQPCKNHKKENLKPQNPFVRFTKKKKTIILT